ncbi:protein-disulfide reductase DsbD domain-containing protein [Thalassococcus lentus]|uniref:Protein-disulfide reductase DsbD family protein n=1 Tax=Thalassococcus lentus TaxID=1210524 RepID=A0ABT4XML8_9RHOB|nr:protein-disulfide reductase DsbD domain-containing protein [Thalassococcus lentus]MDA7423196.1 protein-disulfide reductase DsbD family protein [Thalassococcus lentus]
MKRILALLVLLVLPAVSAAQSFDDVIEAELRPGWRLANGDHMAALHLKLAPGWKTYWRAPGDAGIPPHFDWRGSRGMRTVAVHWPTPHVFWQSGMRSIGYDTEIVLPLQIAAKGAGQDIKLKGVIDIGICKDVCLPHRVRVDAILPASAKKPDGKIAAALADAPLSAAEAGVRAVHCRIEPNSKGVTLRTEVTMPRANKAETVIEAADPKVWVAEPKSHWKQGRLISETQLRHVDGGSFALNRSGLRITILKGRWAVDIQGCTG